MGVLVDRGCAGVPPPGSEGYSFETFHGLWSVDLSEDQLDLTPSVGQSIPITVDVTGYCANRTYCAEVCEMATLIEARLIEPPQGLSLSSYGGSPEQVVHGCGGEVIGGHTTTFYLDATASYLGEPAYIEIVVRGLDAGSPHSCIDGNTWLESDWGIEDDLYDSTQLTLSIPINGAAAPEPSVRAAAVPGEPFDVGGEQCCWQVDPCFTVSPTGWYEGECYEQQGDCWYTKGNFNCRWCYIDTIDQPEVFPDKVCTPTPEIVGCNIPCPAGTVYEDGAECVCPDGSVPDPIDGCDAPVVCPAGQMLKSASADTCGCPEGQVLDAEGGCVCEDNGTKDHNDACTCPALVDYHVPRPIFDTQVIEPPAYLEDVNRFRRFRKKQCNPWRARWVDPSGDPVEASHSFFTQCPGRTLRFHAAPEPDHQFRLEFENVSRPTCSDTFAIREDLVSPSGFGSGATTDTYPLQYNEPIDIRPDSALIQPGTVDFSKARFFEPITSQGRAEHSRLDADVSLTIGTNLNSGKVPICVVPDGLTLDLNTDVERVTEGLALVSPYVTPLSTSFAGRQVQEWIVPSNQGTCLPLINEKLLEMMDRFDTRDFVNALTCDDLPHAQYMEFCDDDGVLTQFDKDVLYQRIIPQVVAMEGCVLNGITSNLGAAVPITSNNQLAGVDRLGFTVVDPPDGDAPSPTEDTSPQADDFCVQVIRRVLADADVRRCEDAWTQHWRISCDPNADDPGGTYGPFTSVAASFVAQSLVRRINQKRMVFFYGRDRIRLDPIDAAAFDAGANGDGSRRYPIRTIWEAP